MPTGYTCGVQEGTVTSLRQFALICARAMGALITMRDDSHKAPVPRQLEPNIEHYKGSILDSEVQINELERMTTQELEQKMLQEHCEAMDSWRKYREKHRVEKQRYEDMILKVEQWQTEVDGLKEFMLSQLRQSIKWDCRDEQDDSGKPELLPIEVWKQNQIDSLNEDMINDHEYMESEIERTNERNEWLSKLWSSLPPE